MTKGRAAFTGRIVAEREPFFITLGGMKSLRENALTN
jgi:hypothetical protein